MLSKFKPSTANVMTASQSTKAPRSQQLPLDPQDTIEKLEKLENNSLVSREDVDAVNSSSDIEDEEQDEDEEGELVIDTIGATSIGELDASSELAVSPSNDANNNNNNNNNDDHLNNNNNNNNNNSESSSKKNEGELLDIVQVSRQRRLSKESADSLTSFIKWSFAHIDQRPGLIKRALGELYGNKQTKREHPIEQDLQDVVDERRHRRETQEMIAEDHKWQGERHRVVSSQIEKQTPISSSITNNNNINISNINNINKRPRYSPELRLSQMAKRSATSSSSASHLGNVVDRLHHNHNHHHHQQQQRHALANSPSPANNNDQSPENLTGFPFNLQQFLQQQTSVEDLCSSFGIEDNNNQLALAAAIHKALVGTQNTSTTNNNNQETNSTTSSTGSSNGACNTGTNLSQQHLLNNPLLKQNHLIDSIVSQRQQRRAYNTRASNPNVDFFNQTLGSASNQHQSVGATSNQLISSLQHSVARSSSNNIQVGAMNMTNNRLQQQHRHAQAAAALSALANANSAAAAAAAAALQQQQQQHQQQLHHPFLNSFHSPGLNSHNQQTSLAAALNSHQQQMVDFKCDTCPSSFDDRHRLMQHQSIHLELKKDWFTETPVDEVMKIFNRRRGEFLCNICNLRFEATLDYDQHNHQVHGPRPYCCQFCGNGTRTFKCWRQYLNHLYDHRYIFSCTIDDCDFTVNRRDSLRFHIFRFHLNCQLPQNSSTTTSLQFNTSNN